MDDVVITQGGLIVPRTATVPARLAENKPPDLVRDPDGKARRSIPRRTWRNMVRGFHDLLPMGLGVVISCRTCAEPLETRDGDTVQPKLECLCTRFYVT